MTSLTESPDTLTRLRDDAHGTGLTLVRATPRGADRLLVSLAAADGSESVGQWFADPSRCSRAVRETAAVSAPGSVRRVADRLMVQEHGADRRLPALHRLVHGQGAVLLAHRPERRGVATYVEGRSRRYVKVMRPDRAAAMAATLRTVAATSAVRVPLVVDSDTVGGRVTLAELPGRTLHDLLGDPGTDAGALGTAVGRAVRRLHEAAVPAGTPRHDAAAERRVVTTWLDRASDHGVLPLPRAHLEALLRETTALLDRGDARAALLHRDLHDKQLLVDDDVGLLDLDLAAAGDPALDLANLLVHLELRAHQGRTTADRSRACLEGVLDGYRPSTEVGEALHGHGPAARLRLACVYAFRPRSRAAALRLLTHPLFQETS